MVWYFSVFDGDVFLYLKKEPARDPKTRKTFGKVEDILIGKSKDEVVVKFHGSRDGIHLSMKFFQRETNEFCKSLSTESQKQFVSTFMQNSGIHSKRKANIQHTRKRKRPRLETIREDVCDVSDPINKAKKIIPLGTREILIENIINEEESIKLRKLNDDWIDELEKKLSKSDTIITTVPVVVRGNEVNKIEDIKETQTYYALGGCHLLKAIKKIGTIRSITAHVYNNLTTEEELVVAAMHNFKMDHLPLSFQDKVNMGRQLMSLHGEDNLQRRLADLLSTLLGKEVNKNSLSTIISVAKYCPEDYEIYNSISPNKSLSPKLFKLIQGCPNEMRTMALKKATENYQEAVNWLEKEKTRSQLRSIFVKQTRSDSWDDAKITYPEYAENLDNFKDKRISSKLIPTHILDYCEAAINYNDINSAPTNITAKMTVKIGDKEIKSSVLSKIISRYESQIINEIQTKYSDILKEE